MRHNKAPDTDPETVGSFRPAAAICIDHLNGSSRAQTGHTELAFGARNTLSTGDASLQSLV